MYVEIPQPRVEPGQVICIDSKIYGSAVKDRQTAFTNRFAQGCNGTSMSFQQKSKTIRFKRAIEAH